MKQAEFLEWFEKIKGQLGEDQAGNLQLHKLTIWIQEQKF